MTKLLFIAHYFPPDGGAGVQRALKFVQYLPAEGFLPVVLTGPVSRDYRWTPHDYTLLNAIPPYVPVHRTEERPPETDGKLRSRTERLLALPTPFARWWVPATVDLGVRVVQEEAFIFATMSPFASGEAARRLSLRLGIPWVADLRDPWALDEMQVYLSAWHRRLELRKMEQLLSTAALIVMNTPEAGKALQSAFPRLHQPLAVITNGYDGQDFTAPIAPRSDGKFRIVHSGYLHTDRGMQVRRRGIYRLLGGVHPSVDILTRSHTVLLDAVARWCEQTPELRKKVEIVLAGKASEQDHAAASRSPVASLIRFPGYLPHEQSLELVRTADLLFLPMHNLPPGERSRVVPGKTYEYMAAARPILAAVPDGDARDFLARCGMAFLCRPEDVRSMIEILRHVYSAWCNRNPLSKCNWEFVRTFERQTLTRKLAAAFRSLPAKATPKRQRTSQADLAPSCGSGCLACGPHSGAV